MLLLIFTRLGNREVASIGTVGEWVSPPSSLIKRPLVQKSALVSCRLLLSTHRCSKSVLLMPIIVTHRCPRSLVVFSRDLPPTVSSICSEEWHSDLVFVARPRSQLLSTYELRL